MSEFILDVQRMKNEINNLKIEDIGIIKIYNLVCSCYNITFGEKININNFISELAKQSLFFQEMESKFYPYFDVVLTILFMKRIQGVENEESEGGLSGFKKHLNISFKKILTDIHARDSLKKMESKEV